METGNFYIMSDDDVVFCLLRYPAASVGLQRLLRLFAA
ncbi:hypothetical protein Gotri_001603, partial [Gossypium trilobum]|nr:hypothetical protein [Gossypium trilobum]MBA0844172.1 hypothetical protein [Gossypium armourianum]